MNLVPNRFLVFTVYVAILYESKEIVEMLLRKEEAVNIDTKQVFPVHLAIENGIFEKMVNMLIEYGAQIDIICNNKLSNPIFHAVKFHTVRIERV